MAQRDYNAEMRVEAPRLAEEQITAAVAILARPPEPEAARSRRSRTNTDRRAAAA